MKKQVDKSFRSRVITRERIRYIEAMALRQRRRRPDPRDPDRAAAVMGIPQPYLRTRAVSELPPED